MLRKYLGDPCQHTCLVSNVQADVVAGGGRIDGERLNMAGSRFRPAGTAQNQAPGSGDDVSQHCRCRRSAACALTVEHQLTRVFRLDEDGVEGAMDGRQRVLPWKQRGVHPHSHAVSPSSLVIFSAIASSLMTKPASLAAAMSSALTPVMPSQYTSSSANRVWKESEARMAAFAAAS